MAKLYNRAWMNSATVGTGTLTLGTAQNGYFTFADALVANGDVVSYTIIDGTEFEIGIGTYTSAGTTLSRDTVTRSKVGGVAGTTKITCTGNETVFISARSQDLAPSDAQYIVLAANSDLTVERILTAGNAITLTDSGAGAALTIAAKMDYQNFDASGTWTKPSGYSASSRVLLEAWGAGGSGGRAGAGDGGGGGGGGGYVYRWAILSDLGATETITIGAGGASRTVDNTDGAVGGNTTIGTLLTAYGGGGGDGTVSGNGCGGGGGGGNLSAGATAVDEAGGNGGNSVGGAGGAIAGDVGGSSSYGGGGGGSAQSVGGGSVHGGGGGGGGHVLTTGAQGGSSYYGGGGGGGGGDTTGGAGGGSSVGGSGGAGSTGASAATAGSQPGGGGGGSESGNSGAGGAGRVRITVFS